MGTKGAGRVMFAATMLLILGALNIVYGLGALDRANVFVGDTRLVFDDLNTYGWVLIGVGALQLVGGFSLAMGNVFGRVIGVIAGSVGALMALLSIGTGFPFWSLAMFALCCWVVHGILVYGEQAAEARDGTRVRGEPRQGEPLPRETANRGGTRVAH
ncbi:hypothetical protein HJD18_14110 [Thermoleophilia bacterium SCSIO 60948]|nr:hypothetical protein HJD18_14110 [Thermoleophilia bacterium SCSIO 60948]